MLDPRIDDLFKEIADLKEQLKELRQKFNNHAHFRDDGQCDTYIPEPPK